MTPALAPQVSGDVPPDAPSPTRGRTWRPVRVLHFHSSKGLYGPERWTHLALRAVPAERVTLEVLTIGVKPGYDDFARFLHAAGLPAHHLAIGGKIGPDAVRAIRGVLTDRRIDVLHTHGFKTDILGYFAARGLGVALVTTPHGWCDHESFRIRAYETVGRMFLRGFDRVYPVSDHQVGVLARHRLGGRVRRIRNAVDIAAFDDVWAARQAHGSAGTDVLFVGRVCREKGVLDLIRAVSVVRDVPAIRARIVGEGPARAQAAALAADLGVADRVEFLGFQRDVRPFLRDASLLALPSYSEGIPRVAMEAFAAGVPVVGTDIPGLRELVTPGETGMLVPTGDADALATALSALLRDPERARRIAARAREVVGRDYSPERLAAELCEEYEAIASARA